MRTYGIGQTRATRIHRIAKEDQPDNASRRLNEDQKAITEEATSSMTDLKNEADAEVIKDPSHSPSEETPGTKSRNHTHASPTE